LKGKIICAGLGDCATLASLGYALSRVGIVAYNIGFIGCRLVNGATANCALYYASAIEGIISTYSRLVRGILSY
jgi:hypothetical protein